METDEVLETGYGPATPPGDNLCHDYAQGMAEGWSALSVARAERVAAHDDLGLTLTDGESFGLFANAAVAVRPLDADGWQEAAARLHTFYAGRPGGDFLVFSAWPTPDLVPYDFGRIGHPPLMLRPPAPLADGDDAAPGLEVRPVADAGGAFDWEQVVVDGFPEPALQPARPGCLLPESALAAPGWHHWVGYVDGRPVGTSSAWVGPTHVDVGFVATRPDARGRGVGRALTATATVAEPGLPAMLIASDAGRGIYERLGYRAVLRFTLWQGHRRE